MFLLQKARNTEKQKTSFLKDKVGNTDLYKFVLEKIMTIYKYCRKYNFVAPLKIAVFRLKHRRLILIVFQYPKTNVLR